MKNKNKFSLCRFWFFEIQKIKNPMLSNLFWINFIFGKLIKIILMQVLIFWKIFFKNPISIIFLYFLVFYYSRGFDFIENIFQKPKSEYLEHGSVISPLVSVAHNVKISLFRNSKLFWNPLSENIFEIILYFSCLFWWSCRIMRAIRGTLSQ